jgi:hypothetical protein
MPLTDYHRMAFSGRVGSASSYLAGGGPWILLLERGTSIRQHHLLLKFLKHSPLLLNVSFISDPSGVQKSQVVYSLVLRMLRRSMKALT